MTIAQITFDSMPISKMTKGQISILQMAVGKDIICQMTFDQQFGQRQ